MLMATEKASNAGRKKRPIPTRVVKLDGDLVGTAEMLAKRQGMTTADYLSSILRPILEREWAKEVKRMTGKEGE